MHVRSVRRFGIVGVLAVAAALALSACSTNPAPPPVYPEITFKQYAPFKLSVSSIEVVQEYTPPLRAPNVEHMFAVSPGTMAARWPRDRLIAAGGPNVARFVIHRASVVETTLPKIGGVRGAFTTQQAQRYDGMLDVELQVLDERGYRVGQATARIERSQTVAEDATVAERERTWFQMVEGMARDMNNELERNLRAGMPRFIVY